VLVTTRTVAGINEKKRLAAAHSAGLVDMEASAVARWAAANSVPFACIKAVSDGPLDPLPDFNPFLSDSGQFLTGRFVCFALVRPRLWPVLIRMGRHSSQAARSLAKYLGDLLTQQGKRF
jgi:adenosylhomocysteine nucleosidase